MELPKSGSDGKLWAISCVIGGGMECPRTFEAGDTGLSLEQKGNAENAERGTDYESDNEWI